MEWYARNSNPLTRQYLKFITWGVFHGAISYFVLVWFHIFWWGDMNAFMANILGGGIVSAVVFVFLLKAPRWLQSLGFPVVSCLLPITLMEGSFLIHEGTFGVPDPLAIVVLILWITVLLPFSIIAGLIYFFRK